MTVLRALAPSRPVTAPSPPPPRPLRRAVLLSDVSDGGSTRRRLDSTAVRRSSTPTNKMARAEMRGGPWRRPITTTTRYDSAKQARRAQMVAQSHSSRQQAGGTKVGRHNQKKPRREED